MVKHSKEIQLSFREEKALVDKVDDAANREELARADFVRKVFRHGFRRYESAGSLHALNLSREEAIQGQAEIAKQVFERGERLGPSSEKKAATSGGSNHQIQTSNPKKRKLVNSASD